MADIIMESVVQIVVTLMLTLIGVLGTWLTLKLGKKEELAAINVAQQEVIRLAHLTVEELQQTLVEGLKAAHEDGKLTTGGATHEQKKEQDHRRAAGSSRSR